MLVSIDYLICLLCPIKYKRPRTTGEHFQCDQRNVIEDEYFFFFNLLEDPIDRLLIDLLLRYY